MPARAPRADLISGALLIALGAAAFAGGAQLPPVPGQQVGPSVFPMVIGAGLALCGLLIALGIGRGFEPDALGKSATQFDAPAEHGWFGVGARGLVPPVALLFYVVGVDRAGFIVTAALMLIAVARALRASWRLSFGLALIVPPVVHLLFYKLLRVPLPAGWLPMPW